MFRTLLTAASIAIRITTPTEPLNRVKIAIHRKGMNHELYKLYDDVELARCVKIQRLRWLSYVFWMDGEAPAGRVYETGQSGGSCSRGRPSTYWRDQVVYLTGARWQAWHILFCLLKCYMAYLISRWYFCKKHLRFFWNFLKLKNMKKWLIALS